MASGICRRERREARPVFFRKPFHIISPHFHLGTVPLPRRRPGGRPKTGSAIPALSRMILPVMGARLSVRGELRHGEQSAQQQTVCAAVRMPAAGALGKVSTLKSLTIAHHRQGFW